jgi:hypothetical protein
LHRIDPQVPLEDQLGVLVDLQRRERFAISVCRRCPSTRSVPLNVLRPSPPREPLQPLESRLRTGAPLLRS